MADLISRAWVLAEYDRQHQGPPGGARKIMVEAPTVDAAPVVHARWINFPECLGYDGAYSDEHIVCSACHSVWNIIDNETDRFDCCPNCGAKMDGERRGSE